MSFVALNHIHFNKHLSICVNRFVIRSEKIRYDNVTLIPLVLQLGLRIGPIQRMGSKLKFSLSEYFNFLFAYLVIIYYSLQFLSNDDTK